MEDFGYWIFLLILYLLSAMMKKKKQKAAYRKLDDEDNNGDMPKFVKELFPELRQELFSELGIAEDEGDENIPEPEMTHIDYNVGAETSPDYDKIVPLEKPPLVVVPLSSVDYHEKIGTLKRKKRQMKLVKASFFKKRQDIKMAVIYKEVLDRPRAIRKAIR